MATEKRVSQERSGWIKSLRYRTQPPHQARLRSHSAWDTHGGMALQGGITERPGRHDHRGLTSLIIVQDDEEKSLELPSGENELLLVLQDRTFTDANELEYLDGGLLQQPEDKAYAVLAPGQRFDIWLDLSQPGPGSSLELISDSYEAGMMGDDMIAVFPDRKLNASKTSE